MLPLAALLRPQTLDEVVGQSHLIEPGKPLHQAVTLGAVFSMIFWGPPGVGKTTLARIVAQETNRQFIELSAVAAGKKDLQQVMAAATAAQPQLGTGLAPILFIDEIHRFNKAQQDYLLPFVERGDVILIGATTENPSFEIISALLSRTQVLVLHSLTATDLDLVIDRAISHLGKKAKISRATRDWLIAYANGDGRKLLTALDQTWNLYGSISLSNLKTTVQTRLRYDKAGEEHYDTISAFIKSMRASDADAALYYLARMVESGEDPKFIARRMVIFASEDIGLAQPTALVVANAAFDAVHKIGYPEAQINLAQAAAYLARAKKDRSAYDAYFAALDDVKQHGNLPIPLHLRNAPTKLMKELGYGKNYSMYPDPQESLLPEKLKGKKYLRHHRS